MTPNIPGVVRRLKRVAPLQCGKVLGILYGLLGLIFVPFFLLISAMGALIPQQPGAPPVALPIVFGLGFALAMPIFYAVSGFIFGVIGAWVYNLVAKWIGGLEVEIE